MSSCTHCITTRSRVRETVAALLLVGATAPQIADALAWAAFVMPELAVEIDEAIAALRAEGLT